MRWIVGKYGWILPLGAALMVLAGAFFLDQQTERELESAKREARALAERRAGNLTDAIGNTLSERIGALTAAKLQFTQLEDSVGTRTFMAAVDSVTARLAGLSAISILHPQTGRTVSGVGAAVGRRGVDPFQDSALVEPLRRATTTGQPAASGVLDLFIGRRVIIFDPVIRNDSVVGVLAAEMSPSDMLRAAITAETADTLGNPQYAIYSSNGVRITTQTISANWPHIDRPIRVADTQWTLRLAYPPVEERVFRVQRIATWVAGFVIAMALWLTLTLLRKTITTQREEIARRMAAEEEAKRSAAEARLRAREARELAGQLEAAQRASQQLSTSLDPDDVVELFLGGVAETLNADVATLYTFEEEGEVVVGRKRIIFSEASPAVERLRAEDIRQVRAPVAMLPVIAEAVATGEPYIITGRAHEMRPLPSYSSGPEAAEASVTVPLLIGGHMVGVATWEVYSSPRTFDSATIAFAQALAAPAAAALRTAELFASLDAARSRAASEALRFGTVLDQMADGVVVVDERGVVERSNKAAEELLGPNLGSVALQDWPHEFGVTTVDGRSFTAADFPLVRTLRGERVKRSNFIVRSPWGGERYLSSSAGPIQSASGETTGAAIVFRDVTDEHQYAEILRHTNRELRQQAEMLEEVNRALREATKAKDQFLAVMSHELRTPINAIMGYSDLLDLGVKGDLSPEQRAMVARVRETSRHLLGLINEVLDLAKIGSGRVDLVLVELELGKIIDRCVQQVMPLATSKGLNLTVHGGTRPDGNPITVLADDTRLAQIVINLLSNAVKFTQQGSVEVSYQQMDDIVSIRVKDTGVGIPQEQLDRIFEEFYQIESGFSRSSGGTGLGLAIARRFTRLMGGDVKVLSEVGKGSEFIVDLPSAEAQARTGADGGEPRLVVLTDDQALVRELEEGLHGAVRVKSASEPPRLAAIARRETPNLVALDSRAPDHAAWRAFTVLQSDPKTATARTLVLGFAGERGDRALPFGPFVTLAKPLTIDDAAEKIQRVAARRPDPVLIADDDPDVVRILGETLTAAGLTVQGASTATEVLKAFDSLRPSALVMDLLMTGLDALSAMARMQLDRSLRNVPIVLLAPRELTALEMDRLRRAVETSTRNAEIQLQPVLDILAQAVLDDAVQDRFMAQPA